MGGQSDRERTEKIEYSNINNLPVMSYLKNRQPGGYYTTPSNALNTTAALTANTLYAIPFVVTEKEIFTRIAIEVTTADAVNTGLRVGIYKADKYNLHPTVLVSDAGTVDVSTNGVREILINQTFDADPGIYWLVMVANGTPTLRAPNGNFITIIYGETSTLGASTKCLSGAFTYDALPEQCIALARSSTAIGIWLRKG